MARYVARRVLLSVFVIFGLSVITFFVSHALPGDPSFAALGPDARSEEREAFRRDFGLDRPLPEQYVIYMGRLLQGDLGRSLTTRRAVREDLREFFPATLELTFCAAVLALSLAIPLGMAAAVSRGRWVDHLVRLTSLLGASMPIFWSGLMLQLIFYRNLGLLPGGSRLETGQNPPPPLTGLYLFDSLAAGNPALAGVVLLHLVLPAFTLSQLMMATVTRMMRSSLLEVIGLEYVRTARAKGLFERAVLFRHALKNALLPVITVFGLHFGHLLGGAILTETIFSWPGLGSYAVDAINKFDFNAVMGVTLTMSLIYLLVNLAVDLSYPLIDPRIRY
jgi:peptide/nickel transport system permease protein